MMNVNINQPSMTQQLTQLTSKAPCGVSTKALDHGHIDRGYIKFVEGNPLDSAFNADPQQVSSKAMGSMGSMGSAKGTIYKEIAMREGLF